MTYCSHSFTTSWWHHNPNVLHGCDQMHCWFPTPVPAPSERQEGRRISSNWTGYTPWHTRWTVRHSTRLKAHFQIRRLWHFFTVKAAWSLLILPLGLLLKGTASVCDIVSYVSLCQLLLLWKRPVYCRYSQEASLHEGFTVGLFNAHYINGPAEKFWRELQKQHACTCACACV